MDEIIRVLQAPNSACPGLFFWLLNASYQAGILIGVIWLGLRIFRIKPAPARFYLWLFALLGVALLPAISPYLPHLRPLWVLQRPAEMPPMEFVEFYPPPVSEVTPEVTDYEPILAEEPVEFEPPEAAPIETAPTKESPWPKIKEYWPLSLTAAWILGAVFFLARLLCGHLAIRRLKSDAREVASASVLQTARETAAKIGLKRNMRLLASSDVSQPATAGIFRPAVILPEEFIKSAGADELKPILIHEFAHIKRSDFLINLFQRLLEAVFFFHPLIWIASRNLRLTREEICDNWVLEITGERKSYARSLAHFAQVLSARRLPATVALIHRRPEILRRIEMILDERRKIATRLSKKAALLILLTFASFLPLISACSLIGEEAKAPEFKQVRYFASPIFWRVDGWGKLTFDEELASPGGYGYWKVYCPAPDIIDRAEYYDRTGVMIRYVLFKYDQEGNISEIHGYKYGGDPWLRQKFSYDEKGRVAEIAYFGRTGKLSSTQRLRYDAQGKMWEAASYDSKGVLQGTSKGTVDENGRTVESHYYYAKGKLKIYSKAKSKYDPAGRRVEYWQSTEYAGKREERTTKNKYNDQGWLIERATYDPDGKVESLEKYKYTEDGRLLERLERFTPINRETSTFMEKFKYDDERRIVESITHSDGRLHTITKYNEFQRRKEYIRYDEKGQVRDRSEYEYDETGKLIDTRRYRANGSLSGITKYDKFQRQKQSIRYDEEGKVEKRLEYEYDEEGRQTQRRYDSDGKLREIWEYDEEGKQIRRHFAPDGNLREIRKYDAFQTLKETIHYDEKGNLSHRWEYVYDEEDRQTERRHYGPDDKLRERWEYEYDEEGRRIRTRHYGPDGKLIEEEGTGGEGKGAKVPEEAAVKEKDERPAGSEAGEATFTLDQSSPEATWKSYQKAVMEKNFEAAYECLSPDFRAKYVPFEEFKTELSKEDTPDLVRYELFEVKITDGVQAAGKIRLPEGKEHPTYFIKIADKWFLPGSMEVIEKERENAKKHTCRNNLKQIGALLRLYANEYDGFFPPPEVGLVAMDPILDKYRTPKIVLLCPSVPHKEEISPAEAAVADYEYNLRRQLKPEDPPTTPLAWDKKDNHPDGRNVLFVDGHGEWMPEEKFQELMSKEAAGEKSERPVAYEAVSVKGRVVNEKGEPLVGAEVILVEPLCTAEFRDGRFTGLVDSVKGTPRVGVSLKTDAQGRFSLPPHTAPYVVWVWHQRGYAEASAEDLSAARELTVAPWGRVEGELLVGKKPAPAQRINLQTARSYDPAGRRTDKWLDEAMHITYSHSTRTDDKGHFGFERVPAGKARLMRFFDQPDVGSVAIRGLIHTVEAKSGQTTRVTLGGEGRPVIGRVVQPAGTNLQIDWDRSRVRLMLPAPSGFGGDEKILAVWAAFLRSEEGRHYFRDPVKVGGDRSFRIEGVPAGEYLFQVFAYEKEPGAKSRSKEPIARLSHRFTVPLMPAGRSNEPFDLGTLELKVHEPLSAGEAPATKAQPTSQDPERAAGSEAVGEKAAVVKDARRPSNWKATLPSAQAELTLKDIVEAMQANIVLTAQSLKVRYTIRHMSVKTGDVWQTSNYLWASEGEKLFCEKTIHEPGKPEYGGMEAFDGEFSRTYGFGNNTGRIMASPSGIILGDDPRRLYASIRYRSLTDLLAGEGGNPVRLLPQKEVIGEHSCYVIEGDFPKPSKTHFKVWIDAQHDFLPVRIEEISPDWRDIRQVTEFQKLPGNLWFPRQLCRTVFRRKQPEDQELTEVAIEEYTFHDPEVGQDIDDEMFVLKYPEGAGIWDEILQTGYYVGEAPAAKPTAEAAAESGVSVEDILAALKYNESLVRDFSARCELKVQRFFVHPNPSEPIDPATGQVLYRAVGENERDKHNYQQSHFWAEKGAMVRWDHEDLNSAGEVVRRHKAAFNGELFTAWDSPHNEGVIEPNNLALMPNLYESPATYFLRDTSLRPYSEIDTYEEVRLLKSQEVVGGRLCYVLEEPEHNPFPRTLYVDSERLVLRKVSQFNSKGLLLDSWEVLESIEVSEGIWFPTKIVLRGYIFHSGSYQGQERGCETIVVEPESIKVNSGLPDDLFRITFEPGTEIHDNIAGTTYEYKAPSEKEIDREESPARAPIPQAAVPRGGHKESIMGKIIKAAKTQCEMAEKIECEFTFVDTFPDETYRVSMGLQTEEISGYISFVQFHERFRLVQDPVWVGNTDGGSAGLGRRSSAYDGSLFRSLSESSTCSTTPRGSIYSKVPQIEKGATLLSLIGLRIGWGESLYHELTAGTGQVNYLGTKVQNRMAYEVVSVKYEKGNVVYELSFDPAHNLRLAAWRMTALDGRLYSQASLEYLSGEEDWVFPSAVTVDSFRYRSGQGEPVIVRRLHLTGVKARPLAAVSDEVFKISFPPGTEVYDGIVERYYVVGGLGTGEKTPEKTLSPEDAAVKEKLQQLITFHFIDTPFGDVMDFVRVVGDINIALDPQVVTKEMLLKPVTLKLENVTVETALWHILRFLDLRFVVKDGVVFISHRFEVMGEPIQAVYDVRDVIAPIRDFEAPKLGVVEPEEERAPLVLSEEERKKKVDEEGAKLAKLIQDTIEPGIWLTPANSVRYRNGQLIIKAPDPIHKKIQEFLVNLRNERALKVLVYMTFIRLTPEFLEEIKKELDLKLSLPAKTPPPKRDIPFSGYLIKWDYLKEDDTKALVERVQKSEKAKIMTAPRLTLFNGQRGYVATTEEDDYAFDIRPVEGEPAKTEEIKKKVRTGVVFDVRPTISADRKYVLMDIYFGFAEITDFAEITTETGQTVKMPLLEVTEIKDTLKVPDGETVVVGGLRVTPEEGEEGALTDILILVTPHIIIQEEVEERVLKPLDE